MPYEPVRDEDRRGHIRFEFDGDRGMIRHRDRRGSEREYRIAVKERGYRLEAVPGVDEGKSRGVESD